MRPRRRCGGKARTIRWPNRCPVRSSILLMARPWPNRCRARSRRPPAPLLVRADPAAPIFRTVIGAWQQFAGARCLDDIDGAIGPELRALGIERQEEMQPLTSVGVRYG